MITPALLSLFYSFGVVVFFLGIQGLIFVPLTIVYEFWKRRVLRIIPPFSGKVTVLVPAYNEEKTIRATISTLLESDYPSLEVIVINDGSTDSTEEVIKDFVDNGAIRYIKKPNGGKASALNMGIEAASGEVVLFTDADSLFLPDTVTKMVRWFGDPSIDAVCGNDAPLHPTSPIQKFLTVTTHIGTGFVRRALSFLHCLPIITGNLGAVRTRVLKEINGFREIWGEDLEITFRLYKHRKKIIFDPEPKVIAECPGTIRGLWKQRIRWIRSYLKIAFLHKDLFFNSRYAPFSFYLPVNFINMAIVPILQIGLLFIIPWAYMNEYLYFTGAVEVLAFLGIIFFFAIAVYSIALDRAYKDLFYIPYGLLILPLSYLYNAVVLYSWYKEFRGADEKWVKVERRNVIVSRKSKMELAAVGALLVIASSALTYYYINSTTPAPRANKTYSLGLSTHFDAWGDWRKAISNITNRQEVELASIVGVSAGRPEWTYFKWLGREDSWSNHQSNAREDLLEMATGVFHKSGIKVAAFIDVFGPKYIKNHPGTAAVSFDGRVLDEQVAFFELVEGNYGNIVLEMIEYLAGNYDIDVINLTEMPYYSYSYNIEDLRSYEAFTGRKGWPRVEGGLVDRDDPSIWEWRSTLMERFVKKAAAAAHKHGKQLYVDVPVSWGRLEQNGRESGLDYERLLRHVDNIVVWNYFFLEKEPPAVSEQVALHMLKNFPQDSFFISLGLWGEKGAVMSPVDLDQGIKSTLKGGVRRIWITPDSLLTEEHWNMILPNLKGNAY